jgi:hypothetical protein
MMTVFSGAGQLLISSNPAALPTAADGSSGNTFRSAVAALARLKPANNAAAAGPGGSQVHMQEPQLPLRFGNCKHVLLLGGREGNFESLVLHPDMFADHRTRSYRAALLDLLRKSAGSGGNAE